MATIVKLPNVRLAFPDLYEPRAFEEGQEPKYGATFLIPKTNTKLVAEIQKAIKAEAAAKWGGKADSVLKSIEDNSMKYCFINGEKKSDYDGYADHWALAAKAKARPLVIDRDRSPLTISDGRPYGGCYVNSSVEIWAQDNKWGKGMRATLRGVQFNKDGDAFAGGRPADAEEFDDLANTGDEDELA